MVVSTVPGHVTPPIGAGNGGIGSKISRNNQVVILFGIVFIMVIATWGNIRNVELVWGRFNWIKNDNMIDASGATSKANQNDDVMQRFGEKIRLKPETKDTTQKVEEFEETQPERTPPKIENGRLSIVTQFPDVLHVTNACVRPESGQTSLIQVFTDVENDTDPFLAKNARARNLRMHFKWERQPAAKWFELTQGKNKGNSVVTTDTLMFPDNELPAHCMHDFLFTLFLEAPEGRKFSNYWPKTHPGRPCDPQKNWCCFVFDRAGVFDAKDVAPYDPHRGYTCFDSLWVIIFGKGRYAPDWSLIKESEHIEVYAHDETKYFALSHLRNLHEKLLYSDDQITMKRTSRVRSKRTNILVLDRTEGKRRMWANANEFVSLLVTRWKELSSEKLGSVHFLGTRFGELAPIDQARLFHHADVIISPHGGQLSNMIFGEGNRTVLVEFHCGPFEPNTTTAFREWGPDESVLLWFSTFPKRLGMRPFVLKTQAKDCHNFIRELSVDPEEMLRHLKSTNIFSEDLIYTMEP